MVSSNNSDADEQDNFDDSDYLNKDSDESGDSSDSNGITSDDSDSAISDNSFNSDSNSNGLISEQYASSSEFVGLDQFMTLSNEVKSLSNKIDSLTLTIQENRLQMEQGFAMSAALAAMPTPTEMGLNFSAGAGNYEGSNASIIWLCLCWRKVCYKCWTRKKRYRR